MKRLILLLSIFAGALATQAQTGCSKDHPIFRFNDPGTPKLVTSLGSDPEFPFLRNLSTPQQVVAAMKRASKTATYRRQVTELNDLLMQAGFTNGINDVTAAAVTPYQVTGGTTGNMGSGKLSYIYCKIGDNYKGWKVASDNGCYVVFFSPCGNAFYPGMYEAPRSITPVSAVEIPVNPIAPVTVEQSASYAGKKECDPCKPKDCCKVKEDDCDRCSSYYAPGYYRRMYRRAYYNTYYRD